MAKKAQALTADLFLDAEGQMRLLDKSVEQNAIEASKVECLGLTFPSEEARRAHFTEILRQKLKDPEFRKQSGFPQGSDEDILKMSDAPWYTACPNPFLADFVREYGRPYTPTEVYNRDPFAVDVSVGKTDALYKAHGYHTKVPHLAIVPSILHYTQPGDIVLDGFSGSGMTGIAAQWCGAAPAEYRKGLEAEWAAQGRAAPKWGARRVILNDLGPAASFISANYNTPFDVTKFERACRKILSDMKAHLGWMYETKHAGSSAKGTINYVVWSEVFACPECTKDVDFVCVAIDQDTKKTRKEFPCPTCKAQLTKDKLERVFVTSVDPVTSKPRSHVRLKPALINYSVGKETFEKVPDDADLKLIDKVSRLPVPAETPAVEFPFDNMWEAPRLRSRGIEATHHLFLPRQSQALAFLWRHADGLSDQRLRNAAMFFVEQAIWGMSLLARYAPTHFSQVNQYLAGAYYVASQIVEASPWYILEGKLKRLVQPFASLKLRNGFAAVTTGDCASLPVDDNSIDYIFTDPPFGDNLPYAELNFLVEAWHRVRTESEPEAIMDRSKANGQRKDVYDYQELMKGCFSEYYRVLKPGRWITIVFSNSKNSIWRAIQEAMGLAGFVVADVRTLDKQQLTLKQITSAAVKQDLVISAYKPSEVLAGRFTLGSSSVEDAWAFVTEHLAHLPVFTGAGGIVDVLAERTAHVLYDRLVAFHVQRQLAIPLSTGEFLAGIRQRYPERDGMFFLPSQVNEYDSKRMRASELKQLDLFIVDEASAIQWLRRELATRPRSLQDLTPVFLKEIQNWIGHEKTIELKDILRQNFLHYEGMGLVPDQIRKYLSANYKDCRNLKSDDPQLVAKAKDRWYVPDPKKQDDIDKVREKELLKEFETYKASKERRLKTFRTEAVRAGFGAAYAAQDYKTIVTIGNKLPENVVHEDEKLLMYYDVALLRVGDA